MRVLFDIVHPAHVHFYRHVAAELASAGHAIKVVARSKDVTLDLLDHYGIPHVSVGRADVKRLSRQAVELALRDWALLREARRFRPDLILTRSPAGTHVARLVGARSVFDTDDGRAAKLHFWSAAPLAHVITSPTSLDETYGRRHRRYPGYKALAFLHPNRFQPDMAVLDELGVEQGESFSVVRFAGFFSSHDKGESGLPEGAKRRVIEMLAQHGKVFVSSEGPVAPDLEGFRFSAPAHRLHDALALASLVVGDSQSVALEAGLLGSPSVHCSTWSGRLATMRDLERRYELVRTYRPSEAGEFFAAIEALVSDPQARPLWRERRARMLAEGVDVSTWYLSLLGELASS